MPTELEELNADALKDLGRVQKVEGHNDMIREELLDALDGPVDDDMAALLGKKRQELYEMAKDRGIDGDPKDMQKWELIEALSGKS